MPIHHHFIFHPGQFNYTSELPGATATTSIAEIFPEPQEPGDPDVKPTVNLYSINHFFPWQLNQDGTGEETLNHVGRHELHNFFNVSLNNDANLVDFIPYVGRPNVNVIRNILNCKGRIKKRFFLNHIGL